MFCRLFLLILLLPLTATAESVAWDGPGAEGWLTRSSEHFDAHYPASDPAYEALALHSLNIAEQAHRDLMPFFTTPPVARTQLVLSDDQDIANGWATFFPFSQIRLYLTPPHDLNGLENYDDWLALLIRHEYVHILHMEMGRGAPEKLRSVFGRVLFFFPHSLISPMLIEGLAVYLETDYEAGTGRLASSWYQMQMREEVRSGEFATLGEAAISSREWPYGQYYLYGAFFIEYLIQTYGEEKLQMWLSLYSGEIFPYLMLNSTARRIYGRDFDMLWTEFRLAMEQRFGDENAPLASSEETLPATTLRQQVSGSDGQAVYYVASDDEDRPVLQRCTGVDADCTDIADGRDITSIDVLPDGRVIAVRALTYASGRYSADLWLLDEGDWVPLTQGARVSDARWLPDGSGFVFTSFRAGFSHLLLLSEDGTETLLWRGEYGEYVGAFDIKSDGTEIIAAFKTPGRSWELASKDVADSDWTLLTDSAANEAQPRFTADDRLLFIADYSGEFGIYEWQNGSALSLASDDIDVARSFDPWITGDRLWSQEYTAGGFLLRNTELPLARAGVAYEAATTQAISLNQVEASEPTAYEPWSTLRPHYWLPVFYGTEDTTYVGFSTGGTDALGRHNYQVDLAYGTEQKAFDMTLIYQYQRWLFGYDVENELFDINETVPGFTVLKDQQWRIQRNWLVQAMRDRLGLHSGLVSRRISIDRVEPGVVISGGRAAERHSVGLALTFNDQRGLLHSPGGFGGGAELIAEDFSLLNDDFSGVHVQPGFSYMFDLPGRQSLMFSLNAGFASDDAPGWQLGGLPPQEDYSLFGREQLSLRGFDAGNQLGRYYDRERLVYAAQLSSINDNWSIWPLGLDDVELRVFLERGRAWTESDDPDPMVGTGAELRLNSIIGYRALVPVVIGVAQGIQGIGSETQGYFGIQAAF
ncbi:MAG: hypothetical protein C9355_00210 [Thalassolituus maritimus]|nr:MAG: hypothetical protein C9355_00210 [Thalassolituus maritimus]